MDLIPILIFPLRTGFFVLDPILSYPTILFAHHNLTLHLILHSTHHDIDHESTSSAYAPTPTPTSSLTNPTTRSTRTSVHHVRRHYHYGRR